MPAIFTIEEIDGILRWKLIAYTGASYNTAAKSRKAAMRFGMISSFPFVPRLHDGKRVKLPVIENQSLTPEDLIL
jgi:hypothetical protein